MIRKLIELGLTDGEAKVYLALQELGPSTVGPIVKRSGIAYSNIYEVLQRLAEKGFVSFFKKDKIKYFQAAKPTRIIDFLEKKEQQIKKQKIEASKIVKELKKMQVEETQEAEIFIGTKGLKTAYEALLTPRIKGETAYYILVHEHEVKWGEVVDDFYLKQVNWFRKQNIKWKGVASHSYRNSAYHEKAKKFSKTRFVDFPLPATIDFYNNKALIISWSQKPVSILIHSKDFTKTFRRFFEKVWEVAKD